MSDSQGSMNGRDITLVLGGTGKTGRRIVERLRARGVETRVGSRTAPIPFDWDDSTGWPLALRGVRSVYVSYAPDVAIPAAAGAIESFTALAVRSGVSRLVMLSGRGEPEAQACEEIVRSAGAEWTVVRSSWFCQNFSESFLRDAVMSGTVALPVGDVGEPFVDADDIADVAVAALTDPRHAGELYEVTGPALLTFADATAEIARATGRTIRYEQVPLDAYRDGMIAGGVPDDAVALVTYLFDTVLDGRNSHLADGVERALGCAPGDFASYARRAAAAGAWSE